MVRSSKAFYSRELGKPILRNSQIPQDAVKHMGHTVKGLTEIGCNSVAPGSAKFLFIPDITAKATGIVLVVLLVVYVASQLGSTLIATATADPNQRRLMLLLPLVFVVILYRYPAGLLVYWITTNLWTVGQQFLIRRRLPPPEKPTAAGQWEAEPLHQTNDRRRRRRRRCCFDPAAGGRRCACGRDARPGPAAATSQKEEALG